MNEVVYEASGLVISNFKQLSRGNGTKLFISAMFYSRGLYSATVANELEVKNSCPLKCNENYVEYVSAMREFIELYLVSMINK